MNYGEFASKWKFDASFFGSALTPFDPTNCKSIHGACYLIEDDDGFLSYVGKASCRGVVGRVRSHEEKRWFRAAHVIKTDESSALTCADVVEGALIRVFQPYANRQRYMGLSDVGTDVWVLDQIGIKTPFHTEAKPFAGFLDVRAGSFPKPKPGEPKGQYHARLMDAICKYSLGARA